MELKVDLTDLEIAKLIETIFDMRPYFIEQRLKLRQQCILRQHHMVIWVENQVLKQNLSLIILVKLLRIMLNYSLGKIRLCR